MEEDLIEFINHLRDPERAALARTLLGLEEQAASEQEEQRDSA